MGQESSHHASGVHHHLSKGTDTTLADRASVSTTAQSISQNQNQGQTSPSNMTAPSMNIARPQSASVSSKAKFRRGPGHLLMRGVAGAKRLPLTEVSHGKKPKSTSTTASSSEPQHAESRERLLSCPDFHHHTESEMVKRLERLLTQKVVTSAGATNQSQAGTPLSTPSYQYAMKLFDGANPPKISVTSYLQRMVYYLGGIAEQERKCGIDEAVHSDMAVRYVLAAILYLERIQTRTGMLITVYNVHRLLITGTMIAAKVLDDFQPNQKYFADLGGVSATELSRLEAAFLQLCDYNVNINPEMFAAKYATALERERVFSDVTEALTLGAVFSPRITAKTLVA